MADLSFAEDDSVDLVYSGQSIEHVTEEDGDIVLEESFRVLRPGGIMAIDTPNGLVCRLQQQGFIDPDHKVEYTLDELRQKVTRAGFTVLVERGLNWGGPAVARGEFDPAALAGNRGIFYDAAGCYLLALVIQKRGLSRRRAGPQAGRLQDEDRESARSVRVPGSRRSRGRRPRPGPTRGPSRPR